MKTCYFSQPLMTKCTYSNNKRVKKYTPIFYSSTLELINTFYKCLRIVLLSLFYTSIGTYFNLALVTIYKLQILYKVLIDCDDK